MSLETYFKTPERILSEEEQTLSAMESQAYFQEITYALEDIERLEGMHTGLEGLSGAVARIESATGNDLALIQSAGDLALAGTGADHKALFPSLESSYGQRISTEGLVDIIRDLWKAIVRAVKRVWEAILGFFGKVYDQAGRLKKQNSEMRKRMNKLTDKRTKSSQTDLGNEAANLAIADRVPKNGKEIVDNLTIMSQQASVVFTDYANQLANTGEKLIGALNRFDLKKPSESLERVVAASETLSLDAVKTVMTKISNDKVKDSRWPSSQVIAGAHLMGNKNVFHVSSLAQAEKGNVLQASEVARKRELTLANTYPKPTRKITMAKIKTLTPAEGIAIAQLNEQIIETVIGHDKRKDQLAKIARNLEKVGNDLERSVNGASDKIPDNASAYINEALRYVSAYGQWVAKPMVEMGSHFYTVVRATITAANKSAANYED